MPVVIHIIIQIPQIRKFFHIIAVIILHTLRFCKRGEILVSALICAGMLLGGDLRYRSCDRDESDALLPAEFGKFVEIPL